MRDRWPIKPNLSTDPLLTSRKPQKAKKAQAGKEEYRRLGGSGDIPRRNPVESSTCVAGADQVAPTESYAVEVAMAATLIAAPGAIVRNRIADWRHGAV